MKRTLWATTLCCILATAVAFAQTATTSLRGVVKDPAGALVPGASITLLDPATGTTYHAVSDAAGFYIFPAVEPAHYGITVTAKGFATEDSAITLLVSQPTTVNFALTVSRATVTVMVNSATTALNQTDATEGNAVGNAVIESLPMDERNPISLLTLQPGVLYIGSNTDSRQGSVAGGRSDQGNVTLDGLDDNDEVFGTAFTGILRSTLDSTEEFRVVTSNGTAEASRSSGAQIELITKSGTNQYHGALYEYYRPNNVVANSFFNKYGELASGEPNDPQFYLVNTFGGAIGGPIKKDKLFYFFNYEGQRTGTHQVVGATLPTTTFMAGDLTYEDTSGNYDLLQANQVASLDAPCESNTFNGQPVCPNGPGANAAVLAYYANNVKPKVAPITGGSPILGDGYNSGAYFFTSPAPSTLNTSILKIDYAMNSKNHFFVRGNLQKDTAAGAENLPGQPAGSFTDDNTKGLAAGYTWIPTSHIVNDLRYGFIRQGYQINGPGQSNFVSLYGLTQPVEYCDCGTLRHVPVNEITDTLNWTKGAHSFAFGGTWDGVTDHFGTDSSSFDTASTNPLYDDESDLPAPGPANGNPAINSSFYTSSWANAWGNLMGSIPELTNTYNYQITSATTATALANGAFVLRNFHSNEFEGFVQDTWHVRSNVSLILGVRYTNLQTPYETNGQQISPTINMDEWYKKRETAALQSQIYEPDISLEPSGKANNRPGYYPKQKDNFAPRIGVVFAPDPRTSVRASFGIYFDHYGEALVNDFSQYGSAGLATSITNPPDALGFEDSPRFTGPTSLPNIPLPASPTSQTFPYTPPADAFSIYWGIDNVMKTPYAEGFNFSLQHQFAGGWVFEQAYVGRLGRHLLQQLDLAEPTDFVDPNGGGDYFAAAKILSKAVDAAPFGTFNGATQKVNNNVPAIPYFEHVFPTWKNTDYAGESATQAIFNNAWSPTRYYGGETLALAILDAFPVVYGYGSATQSTFWEDQFSSLYALDTIGNSSYNALQFTLRHPASHGLTVDFGYTFSKSLDLGSETERGDVFTNADDGYVDFGIQNTWNPKLNKAVSDFDTHSLFTTDWIYALPVGRGKAVLGDTNRITDAFLGGWQFAGLARVTSGLPFSLLSQGYPTNYENPGWGIATQPIIMKKTFVGGVPYVMDQATVANINSGVFTGTGPIRYPYAGEAGERNYFRGDGYFDIDSSLTKSWNLADKAQLKFAAEAYNITNSDRFDVSPAGLNPQLTFADLGAYSSTLSTYRRMQFGLRLDF
jgi:Carboxypeptidase regulatory-like domain/TonB dependent receptor